MRETKRYLLLAILFLVASLVVSIGQIAVDATREARFNAIAKTAIEQAAGAREVADYQRLIDSLPQPAGWYSYSVYHRTLESPSFAQPSSSRGNTPLPIFFGEVIASATQHGLDRPLLRMALAEMRGRQHPLGAPVTVVKEGQSVQMSTYLDVQYTAAGPLWLPIGLGFWLLFWVMLALWLYHDAKLRLGKPALPWLALGLLGGPIGIVIWLIQRPAPPAPAPVCPSCQALQVDDATYCVACGAHLKPTCPECGRGIEREWKHCPTCGGELNEASA